MEDTNLSYLFHVTTLIFFNLQKVRFFNFETSYIYFKEEKVYKNLQIYLHISFHKLYNK